VAVGDFVGVGVGVKEGVEGGVGVTVGDLEGVAPGEMEGVGLGVEVAEMKKPVTLKEMGAQLVTSPVRELHMGAPEGQSNITRVTFEARPQFPGARGKRVTFTGGDEPARAT